VDGADKALEVVVGVATRGGDLEEAVRELLHACGRGSEALAAARRQCQATVARQPGDVIARRSIELLDGALRTPLFAPALQ
jgi:hypothetical protein